MFQDRPAEEIQTTLLLPIGAPTTSSGALPFLSFSKELQHKSPVSSSNLSLRLVTHAADDTLVDLRTGGDIGPDFAGKRERASASQLMQIATCGRCDSQAASHRAVPRSRFTNLEAQLLGEP